jgi:hypothetical protein
MARYSWEAQQKRAQREEQRRLRELQRQAKEQAKLTALEQARLEVAESEAEISMLLSVHKDCGSSWDWKQVVSILTPPVPQPRRSEEFKARLGAVCECLSPEETATRITAAQRLDAEASQTARVQFDQAVALAKRYTDLGLRILAGEPASYREAILSEGCFNELSELGCGVKYEITNPDVIDCEITVPGTRVIPAESKTLSASGKVSVKGIPKGRFHEIYEDFLCGSALRVARELFALLPVGTVVVHGLADCADPVTGRESEECVLSVVFDRCRIESLDFDHLDASDTVATFPSNCDFKATRKTGAFKPVARKEAESAGPVAGARDMESVARLLARAQRMLVELREFAGELAPEQTGIPFSEPAPSP